jgi:hypothetical protein
MTSGALHVRPPLVDLTYSIAVRTVSGQGPPAPATPLKSKSVYVTWMTSSDGEAVRPGSTAIHGLSRKWRSASFDAAITAGPKVVPPFFERDTEMPLLPKLPCGPMSMANEA